MMRDRSSLWIAMADVLFAILAVVIVQVAPTKATDGIKDQSWYLISIESDVGIDSDSDIWLIPPSQKPVFYGSRDVGCARLDSDNRGYLDQVIKLADGSKTRVTSNKETIQLRCIEPGGYQLGVNLFAYRESGMRVEGRTDLNLKVHAEIIGVNPSVHTVYAGDVTLNSVGETKNITGFDLDREGNISLTPPQLEEVTAAYARKQAGSSYTPGGQP